MTKIISVTDMARSISDVIGQVYYQHTSFDIKKGANIVAKLTPVRKRTTAEVKDLNNLFSKAPHLNDEDNSFENDIQDLKLLKDNGGSGKWD